jgi:hypothetical protein
MRAAAIAKVALVGLVVGFASMNGCSGGSGPITPSMAGAAGSSTGTAGAQGAAGTGTAGTAGTAGIAGTGAAGNATPDAGTGAAGNGGAAGMGTAGAAGTGAPGNATTDAGAADSGVVGTTDAGAGGSGGDITKVVPTVGCGMDATGFTPGTLVKFTMVTSGVKDPICADAKCGPWGPWTREYFVQVPTGYNKTKAYPLIFEGPGCGGHGNNLYALPDLADSAIRVGLTPSADAQALHATNPGQGCFDDKEGDDSVDFVFYESLWDQLAKTLCFDKNRVFAAGNSNGASLANELGCKYAGDATHPIRGIMTNGSAGLPTGTKYAPTCTTRPMAGMWIYAVDDGAANPVTPIGAMNRALQVNGCTPAGVSYQIAMFDPFPISATDSTSCKRYQGCPSIAPLVVCSLHATGIGSSTVVTAAVNAGWPTFLKLFSAPPLLTP